MRLLASMTVLVGLLVVPPARAADVWPIPRGPSTEPDPYTVDVKKAGTIPREFLDEASACLLYAGTTYRLESDGTLDMHVHEVTRLNGRKGVEKLGEHRGISWDPAYEKVTLHTARIHKPDGKVIEAQPGDVHVRDVGTDYQVYDTDKQLIVTFPTLGVGDVLEVKWSVRGRNPEHAGHLFRRYSFGDVEYPIVRDEFRVLLPKGRTLKHACAYGKLRPTVTERQGEQYFRWTADNCHPTPKDDGLPSSEELRPNVSVSTFASWEEVGKWKADLRKKCWECTADVKQIVADVTRGMTDPIAKARALTTWLRTNIRYVSIGIGHHYTPHLPGVVVANRYGDCKDGAQLLAVMLREAGLKVELATLGIRDDGQVLEEVPSPWGTHAILAVTIDGKLHWIDTTSSLSGWNQLPHGDHDRMTYLTDENGKVRLVKTPTLPVDQNRYEQTTRLYVGNNGTTRFERTIIAHGMASRTLRDDLLEVPAGERRRKITSELQDSFSNARLLELSVDEVALRDLDGPVKLKVVFEVEDHFRLSGNNERDGNVSDSKIWGRLLSWTLDFNRTVAFELYARFESRHTFEVFLPPAYSLETVPRGRHIRSKWANFRLEVDGSPAGGADVAFTLTTRIDKVRVEPTEFDEFRNFQDQVSRAYRVWMTMLPIDDLLDAPLVEAMLHFFPEDGDAAAVLARLYDNRGKSADARRILARSLAYAPTSKALLEAAVSVANSDEAEEAAKRELVRAFPEEVKYQLDLASTLITRGKRADARKLLEPVLRDGTPQHRADAHYQIARGHYRVDELTDAEKELQAAEKADPASAERLRFRILQAQVAEELGKLEEAKHYFGLAIRLSPEATFPREGLIRLAIAQKKPDEALPHLRRMIVHAGKDFVEQLAIAEYAYRLDRQADAEEFAKKAEAANSTEKGRRLLGLIELKRGSPEKALPLLLRAGSDAITLEALLTANLALGQLDTVGSLVARAERSYPDDAPLRAAVKRVRKLQTRRDALLKLAPAPAAAEQQKTWVEAVGLIACAEESALEIGTSERAALQVQKALELAPTLGLARAWRGRLDLERGKLSRAAADADAAVEATPGYWVGHQVRGVVALEREKGDAVGPLRQAAKLSDEKNAGVLVALARALAQAGQTNEARQEAEKALKLEPTLTEVRELLETLNKPTP